MKIEMSKAEEEEARLTAYVLGELDADETKAVEALLEKSPEARASLKEIEATAALLSAEFLNEPSLKLREGQVDAITSPEKEEKVTRGNFMPLMAVAACACLFTAVGMKQYLAGLESRDQVFATEADSAAEPPSPPKEEARVSVAGLESPGAAKAAGTDSVVAVPMDEMMADPVVRNRNMSPDSAVASESGVAEKKIGDLKLTKRLSQGLESGEPALRRAKKQAKPAPSMAIPNSVARAEAQVPAPAKVPTPAPKTAVMRKKTAENDDLLGGVVSKSKDASKSRNRGVTSPLKRDQRYGREVEELNEGAAVDSVASQGIADSFGDAESYGHLVDNPWVSTWDDGLSTFAIDVDTGTYPNVRRFLSRRASLPPKDSVRIEEMINYFNYDYPEPEGKVPFSVNMEMASCPWAKNHRLLRVGLRGKGVAIDKRPPSNLVFLVDVSGSMRGAEKLDLLKRSMKAMVGELNEDDRIGIVTYSGSSGIALEPTHGDQKEKITKAFDQLRAGGGTNGASGITTAYSLAKSNFVEGGTNRVILATDGDFNVGVTNNGDLIRMVETRAREDKVFLTVLGVGQGNLKEDRMEQIADKGNGSYHYLDTEKEGQKVLVRGLGATLVTVAKDVKVQLDFNPAKVAKYRLIGYANRALPDEAFHDPKADAGEIGAGHTVTAFYEIVPADPEADVPEAAQTGSRFRKLGALVESDVTLQLALNYKLPDSDDPEPTLTVPLIDPEKKWPEASEDFRFGAAVAGFGILLRGSDYAGLLNHDLILELGGEGITEKNDPFGMRAEFMDLVKVAKRLSPTKE